MSHIYSTHHSGLETAKGALSQLLTVSNEAPVPAVWTRVFKHMLFFIAPVVTRECFKGHIDTMVK